MEGNNTKPRALLVFGAPCSGKTTFARKFADKFGLAYYNLEEIKNKNNFSEDNMMTILDLISRTHQTVVVEGNLDTEKDRRLVRRVFFKYHYDTVLIWVQTDATTIKTRMKLKYKSITKAKDVYNKKVEMLEAPTELEHPVILSGKHTFETQTRHVLSSLADVDKR